jgi:signal transduction histidine kinase
MKTLKSSSIEGLVLIGLLVAVAVVLIGAWGEAMRLRSTVAANAAVMKVDSSALTEIEHLRNLADSEIQNARAYFLMGSKSVFEKQEAEKNQFANELAAYEKKHAAPQVHEIVKKITDLSAQEADLFRQAEEFRAKQTESKIVGQFYQAKTSPILKEMNDQLDKGLAFHKADLSAASAKGTQAGVDAQNEIPKAMSALSTAIAILSGLFALLVIRVLASRARVLRERERLVDEAKAAIISRDEAISAFTYDFKEPLENLKQIATSPAAEMGALVTSTVVEMEALMADIHDQTKASTGGLFLRLEQLSIADILDDAQSFLQPLAKQRDITLQFDAVNPTVLAYVDRERVMRVLANLVGNAIKFSPKHSRVNVKVKADAQFANISILDSAPQIPESRMASLFDNFWQARRSAVQGAGVGLTVVKTIIEAHGGIVKVEHNLQGGNTFTFSLPRRRPANAQLKKPQSSGVRKIARAADPFETAPPQAPTH